jgi:hypothetical protein
MIIPKSQQKTIVSLSIQKLGMINNLYLLSTRITFLQPHLNSLNLSQKNIKKRILTKKKAELKQL